MTPAELKTLIDSDTEAARMAGIGDDSGCAARCSAIAPTIRREVPANALRRKLASLGKLSGILRVARNFDSPDPPYQQAATLMDLIDAGEAIDLDDPLVATGAPELVQHGLLTQPDIAAINALADSPQTITPAAVSEAMFATRYPGGM